MKTTEITDELLDNYQEALLALAVYLDVEPDEITDEGNDRYSYSNEEYLVCDDATADEYWDKELEYYIDELILDQLPAQYRQYFDREGWKSDAKYDGRGHSLSSYDGCENVETIEGTDYYIFRQN